MARLRVGQDEVKFEFYASFCPISCILCEQSSSPTEALKDPWRGEKEGNTGRAFLGGYPGVASRSWYGIHQAAAVWQ